MLIYRMSHMIIVYLILLQYLNVYIHRMQHIQKGENLYRKSFPCSLETIEKFAMYGTHD